MVGPHERSSSLVSGGLGLVVGVTDRYDETSVLIFSPALSLAGNDLQRQGGMMPARI